MEGKVRGKTLPSLLCKKFFGKNLHAAERNNKNIIETPVKGSGSPGRTSDKTMSASVVKLTDMGLPKKWGIAGAGAASSGKVAANPGWSSCSWRIGIPKGSSENRVIHRSGKTNFLQGRCMLSASLKHTDTVIPTRGALH